MLIDYLPKFLAEIKEFSLIMQSLQPYVDSLQYNIDSSLDNFFVYHCDTSFIKRFENILSIPYNSSLDDNQRKSNIILHYNNDLSLTLPTLHSIISNICGSDNFSISIDYSSFKFFLTLNVKSKKFKGLLFSYLDSSLPSNLEIFISIDYNKWTNICHNKWSHISTFSWSDVIQHDFFTLF